MTAPPDRPRTYSVYARYRKSRLKLMVGLPSLERALAGAERLRAGRFHGRDAVIVVDDLTGEAVEDMGPISVAPPSDGRASSEPPPSHPVSAGPPAELRVQPVAQGASRSALASGPGALLRAIAGGSPIPMAMTAGDGHRIAYANPAFATLLGLPEPALVGAGLTDVISSSRSEIAALTLLCDQVLRTAQPVFVSSDEVRELQLPGAWTYCVSPARGENDEIVGLLVVARETADNLAAWLRQEQLREETRIVNERLLTTIVREQELAERASEEALRISALLAGLDEGALLLDSARDQVVMNAAARSLFGASAEGKRLSEQAWELTDCSGRPMSPDESPLRRVVRGERITGVEAVLMRPGMGPRAVSFTGTSVPGPAGQGTIALLLVRDAPAVPRAVRPSSELRPPSAS
jgi:PAS domain-containing protein